MQAPSPYSQAALQRAQLLQLAWPPMLPQSPERVSPVPVHLRTEELHEARALAAFRLQAAPPDAARSSALRVTAATSTTTSTTTVSPTHSTSSPSMALPVPDHGASRKRKAESQDPDEQIGMPTAEELQEAEVAQPAAPDAETVKDENRRMFEQLCRAQKSNRRSWLPARLTYILSQCGHLDPPNSDLMTILALEAGGPRMSPSDLETILTQVLALRYPASADDGYCGDPMRIDLVRAHTLGWRDWAAGGKAAGPLALTPADGVLVKPQPHELVRAPLYDWAIEELCYGLGRALAHPQVLPHHVAAIERVLAASRLSPARRDRMHDMLLIRSRPAQRDDKGTVQVSQREVDKTQAVDKALLAEPPGRLVTTLVAERLELGLDPGWSDGERLRQLPPQAAHEGLDEALERWLAAARKEGDQALYRAALAGIDDLCRQGHRLGRSAGYALRYLLRVAGGKMLSSTVFADRLRLILDHYQDWKPDPHLADSKSATDAHPIDDLVRSLGVGTALSLIQPGNLPVLSLNKRAAAREILDERPGLDPQLRSRLASLLCLSAQSSPPQLAAETGTRDG